MAEQFDRQSKAEAAVWKARADEEFKKRIADPGSITIEASDTLNVDLESIDPKVRVEAAAALANANGARGVDPILRALRAERDEATFVAFIRALDHLNDVRAIDGLVEALGQPGMSDQAREGALHSIMRYRATWRFGSQIREFYESLSDPEVKARVANVVKAIEK
jgi:hypothetical protein